MAVAPGHPEPSCSTRLPWQSPRTDAPWRTGGKQGEPLSQRAARRCAERRWEDGGRCAARSSGGRAGLLPGPRGRCVRRPADRSPSCCRKEFFDGCRAISADSIDGICARLPSLLTEAKQEDKFKDLYRFTFQFGLDSEEGQRSLHREIAIALWKLVFTQNNPPVLDQWLNFLTENPSGVKGISRDTWNMFLNFTQVIGPDLSNYSEDEAWPSLFDTFVEWEMERRSRDLGAGAGRGALSSGPAGLCPEPQP